MDLDRSRLLITLFISSVLFGLQKYDLWYGFGKWSLYEDLVSEIFYLTFPAIPQKYELNSLETYAESETILSFILMEMMELSLIDSFVFLFAVL